MVKLLGILRKLIPTEWSGMVVDTSFATPESMARFIAERRRHREWIDGVEMASRTLKAVRDTNGGAMKELTREAHAKIRQEAIDRRNRLDDLVASLVAAGQGQTWCATLAAAAAAEIERLRKHEPIGDYLLTADMQPALRGDRLWHPEHYNVGYVVDHQTTNTVEFDVGADRTVCRPAEWCYKSREAMPK